MLLATILTLFFGLLFLSAKFTTNGIKILIEISSVIVIVVSNLLVIIMTIWDIYVRKKNIGKRRKQEKKRAHEIMNVVHLDKEYNFNFEWRKWDVSTDEDSKLTMNDIIEDLFSFKRLKRKLFLFQRKGKKVAKKVQKVKESIVHEDKEAEHRKQIEAEFYDAQRNFLENLQIPKK